MEKIKNPYRFSAIVVLGSLILFMMSIGRYQSGWYGFSSWIILMLTQVTGVFLFLDNRKVGKILLYSLSGFHALNLLVVTIIMIIRHYSFDFRVVYNYLLLSLVVAVFVFLSLLMLKQKD